MLPIIDLHHPIMIVMIMMQLGICRRTGKQCMDGGLLS